MKLERDKPVYSLPPVGILEGAFSVVDGLNYRLAAVRLTVMDSMRGKDPGVKGRPMFFSLDEARHELHVFPCPDADGEIFVRYYPPMVEI